MYNTFFGFNKAPFASGTDTKCFYRSGQHDASLRGLLFAVHAQMGLMLLTGEAGTGKTMVLECLHESLKSEESPCAFIRDPRVSVDQFYRLIADDLDLRCRDVSTYKIFSALAQLATQQAERGRSVVLVVDDSHQLPVDVFNEIIHITNLRDEKLKIQSVIAGRPELLPMLDALNLEPLERPVLLSRTLQPFTEAETKEYIDFRLERSGMPKQILFSTDAMKEIYHRTGGLAPAIHELCDQLLLATFAAESNACAPNILNRVFHGRPEQTSREVEIGSAAQTNLELAVVGSANAPDPPPIQTRLLPLTLAVIPRGTRLVPMRREGWDSQLTIVLPPFIRTTSARPSVELARVLDTPMRPAEPYFTSTISIVPIAFTELHPGLPIFSAKEACIAQASRISMKLPLPAESSAVWKRPLASTYLSPVSGVCALRPKWSPGLKTASTAGQLYVSTPFPVAVNSPAPGSAIEAIRMEVENRSKLAIPRQLAVSFDLLPLASSVRLLSTHNYISPAKPSSDPAESQPFPIPWVSTLQAMEPKVRFQPTREMRVPRGRLAIPIRSQPWWSLVLAIAILTGLALYGAPVLIRTASAALNRGRQCAYQALVNRAAVALDEDFSTGLNTWTNRLGVRPSWPRDAAGFVHPGALALYRPSLGMSDYQMRFVGMIDKKGLGWVVRAADFKNYYAIRLAVLKPGPMPLVGVVRYAVVNGKVQDTVTTPLAMTVQSDSIFRVSVEIRGDHFALAVQDQLVDNWSEPRFQHGGIGFFSDQAVGSGITDVQVRFQYDIVGRLCAFLGNIRISPEPKESI